ncbi:hypothetical protein [Jannaschia sp. R86511]|uniref:hypothetical protein n=1 Tax=Jannaschia sp. R86511 TaxID=3093853 RepID=UPI0036D31CB5
MPAYVVDSSKQPMVATGVVDAKFDWVETAGGGRAQSDVQTRDDDTGMPVWGVEVMYQQVQYGRTSSVIASITVPAYDRPDVTALGPITFEGLKVEVRINKNTGGLVEYWSAETIAAPVPGSGRRPSATSSSTSSSEAA